MNPKELNSRGLTFDDWQTFTGLECWRASPEIKEQMKQAWAKGDHPEEWFPRKG